MRTYTQAYIQTAVTYRRDPGDKSDGTRDEHVHHEDDDDEYEGEEEEEEETVDEKAVTVWFNPRISVFEWHPPAYVPGKVSAYVFTQLYQLHISFVCHRLYRCASNGCRPPEPAGPKSTPRRCPGLSCCCSSKLQKILCGRRELNCSLNPSNLSI